MRIGIIGAGELARAFATAVIRGGHEVLLSNSRGPRTLTELTHELGPKAHAGTKYQAAIQETVILAVPSAQVETAMSDLEGWGGRTLVDATNHFSYPRTTPGMLTTSELVAELAPGAHVVKALNNVMASQFYLDPSVCGGTRVIFVSGDDVPSKDAFRGFIEHLGYTSIDLGGLAEGGRLQQLPGGALVGANLVRLH